MPYYQVQLRVIRRNLGFLESTETFRAADLEHALKKMDTVVMRQWVKENPGLVFIPLQLIEGGMRKGIFQSKDSYVLRARTTYEIVPEK